MKRTHPRSVFASGSHRPRGPAFWFRVVLVLVLVGWFVYSGVQVAKGTGPADAVRATHHLASIDTFNTALRAGRELPPGGDPGAVVLERDPRSSADCDHVGGAFGWCRPAFGRDTVEAYRRPTGVRTDRLNRGYP